MHFWLHFLPLSEFVAYSAHINDTRHLLSYEDQQVTDTI